VIVYFSSACPVIGGIGIAARSAKEMPVRHQSGELVEPIAPAKKVGKPTVALKENFGIIKKP
jgi:hypothetical protein